jgi:hypothetical protein
MIPGGDIGVTKTILALFNLSRQLSVCNNYEPLAGILA